MFPNLRAQKAIHNLTNQQMADIIKVNRTTYESKVKTGNFNVCECRTFTKYFGKTFEYLFDPVGDTNDTKNFPNSL